MRDAVHAVARGVPASSRACDFLRGHDECAFDSRRAQNTATGERRKFLNGSTHREFLSSWRWRLRDALQCVNTSLDTRAGIARGHGRSANRPRSEQARSARRCRLRANCRESNATRVWVETNARESGRFLHNGSGARCANSPTGCGGCSGSKSLQRPCFQRPDARSMSMPPASRRSPRRRSCDSGDTCTATSTPACRAVSSLRANGARLRLLRMRHRADERADIRADARRDHRHEQRRLETPRRSPRRPPHRSTAPIVTPLPAPLGAALAPASVPTSPPIGWRACWPLGLTKKSVTSSSTKPRAKSRWAADSAARKGLETARNDQ